MKKLIFILVPLLAFAQSAVDQQFEGTQQLTDQEVIDANNYMHTGLMQSQLEEACKNNQLTAEFGCNNQSDDPARVIKGQFGQAIEEMIPKLYGMIGMMGVVGNIGAGGAGINQIKMKPKGDAAPKADGAKAEGDTKQDACIYIPTVGEMAMAAWQKSVENRIMEPTNQPDPQRDGLYQTARIHEQRSKTAKGQATIYGATLACYTAYLASGAVFDWKLGIKMAAAGGLTYIFAKKAKNHMAYHDALMSIADKLPGKGDCNPTTQTQCFCAHKTSKASDPANYQKACLLKQLAAQDPKTNPMPCFKRGPTGAPVPDYGCECKKSNSCFQHDIGNMFSKIGLGGNYANEALKGLELIGSGQFNDAQIDGYNQAIAAINKGIQNKQPVGDLPAGVVPNRSKAEPFMAAGMSPGFAAIAGGSAPAGAPGTGLGPTPGPSIRRQQTPSGPAEIATQYGPSYQSAKGSGGSRRGGKKDDFINPFATKGKSSSGGSVIDVGGLEEKAIREAEINKDRSSGLFDIISTRYQLTTKERLKNTNTPE